MRTSCIGPLSVVLASAGLVLACGGSGSPASQSGSDSGPSPAKDGGADSGARDSSAPDSGGTVAPDGSSAQDAGGHDAGNDAAEGGVTTACGKTGGAPAQAVAVGYDVNTFSSTLAKATVDVTNSQKSGFHWYLGQFFSDPATPATDLTFNADGTLTLDNDANINSASPSGKAWVGSAFGGGAYFEAVLKFNPNEVITENGSTWPAWWGMAIEHLAGLPGEQWSGQPSGYSHFIETDFFEYDVWSFSPHNEYGGATHDWYGIYGKTCSGSSYCGVSNSGGATGVDNFQVKTPSTTDFTAYHAFGYLWVPATATTKGYAQYYFDGVATNDKLTWSKYDAASDAPPPGSAPWTFGVLDQQHIALILTTGNNEPMTVQSVNVWQASCASNLVQ